MTDDDIRFIQAAMQYLDVRVVDLEVNPRVVDVNVKLAPGRVPLVSLGQGFLQSNPALRRQKIVHELLHVRGLMHDARSRRDLGYYSNPRRDRLSALIRDDIERAARFTGR